MAALAGLHERTEKARQRLLAELGHAGPWMSRRRPRARADPHGTPDGRIGGSRTRPRSARRALPRALHFFTDIDDTLTTDGMLPVAPSGALGPRCAPASASCRSPGRPAGWCDHIARMWPVAGVVGENGAFYYAYDHARRRMMTAGSREPRTSGIRRDRARAGSGRRAGCFGRFPARRWPPTSPSASATSPSTTARTCLRFPPESVDEICRILAEEGVQLQGFQHPRELLDGATSTRCPGVRLSSRSRRRVTPVHGGHARLHRRFAQRRAAVRGFPPLPSRWAISAGSCPGSPTCPEFITDADSAEGSARRRSDPREAALRSVGQVLQAALHDLGDRR